MAFGKPSDKKGKFIDAVVADQLWRANVRSEENAHESWNTKWGWILKEYEELHEKLQEIAKGSLMLKDLQKEVVPDPRTTKPYPESVNQEYGWISVRPEFKLEKYGPDVDKGKPILPEHKLLTDINKKCCF